MKTVVLCGIVTVNFLLEIEPDTFKNVCEENNLDPKNVAKFTENDWLSIRSSLGDVVSNSEENIEYGEIYNHNTLSVDEVTVKTNDLITCLYEQGDAVHSIEIL